MAFFFFKFKCILHLTAFVELRTPHAKKLMLKTKNLIKRNPSQLHVVYLGSI